MHWPVFPERPHIALWTVSSLHGSTIQIFIPYEEAKRIVIEAGINAIKEYRAVNKELGLPLSTHVIYKANDGLIGMIYLKAPIQVLYWVTSCVDKELAKEIETLLDSTLSEDRLNWVKEQLKDVKEETINGAEATSAALDEVSAMEFYVGGV